MSRSRIALRALLLIFSFAALRVGAIADAPPHLAAGDAFPLVDAQSLTGKVVRLPDDRKGRPFVAIFGFSRGSGDRIAQWSHTLHEKLAPSIAIYAVADLSHVPGLFRGFATGGIRKQASPLHPEHDQFVLIMTKSNPWQDIVPNGGGDDATIVAVDANGSVLDIERRPYTDADAARVAELVNRNATQPK